MSLEKPAPDVSPDFVPPNTAAPVEYVCSDPEGGDFDLAPLLPVTPDAVAERDGAVGGVEHRQWAETAIKSFTPLAEWKSWGYAGQGDRITMLAGAVAERDAKIRADERELIRRAIKSAGDRHAAAAREDHGPTVAALVRSSFDAAAIVAITPDESSEAGR